MKELVEFLIHLGWTPSMSYHYDRGEYCYSFRHEKKGLYVQAFDCNMDEAIKVAAYKIPEVLK